MYKQQVDTIPSAIKMKIILNRIKKKINNKIYIFDA